MFLLSPLRLLSTPQHLPELRKSRNEPRPSPPRFAPSRKRLSQIIGRSLASPSLPRRDTHPPPPYHHRFTFPPSFPPTLHACFPKSPLTSREYPSTAPQHISPNAPNQIPSFPSPRNNFHRIHFVVSTKTPPPHESDGGKSVNLGSRYSFFKRTRHVCPLPSPNLTLSPH